ncbi:hypothetical protein RSOLAG22IIIB_05611 [Rhizoctonia solani]|uniref:Uncharacterized protein n=1 Tax=Rhizoctonia solani TaxID=456999 RepID=A0A0K6G7V2_9AGAM|nr:hypothetical protein RSOLAG22IIIB_05611 [Rhizoctonia solani]
MSMKDSKTPQPTDSRPRRHERSSHHHHHSSSRRNHRRSSYVYDSDETEVETDDEPPANSLMLDLGPDFSPKAMSTISFPSPPTRGSTVLFETDEMDNSPQHIETRHPSAAVIHGQTHRKSVQYYDTTAAQAEVSPVHFVSSPKYCSRRLYLPWPPFPPRVVFGYAYKPALTRPLLGSGVGGPRADRPLGPNSVNGEHQPTFRGPNGYGKRP